MEKFAPGGLTDPNLSKIRDLWERRIALGELERQNEIRNEVKSVSRFCFPRWRSNDALSASLVASANTTRLIPHDSIVPNSKLVMLEESERHAEIDKAVIHLPYIINALRKHRQELEKLHMTFARCNH